MGSSFWETQDEVHEASNFKDWSPLLWQIKLAYLVVKVVVKAVVNQVLRKHQDTDPVILSFAQPLKIFLTELLQEGNDPTVVYEALYGDKDNTFVSTKRISRQTIEYAMIGLADVLRNLDY